MSDFVNPKASIELSPDQKIRLDDFHATILEQLSGQLIFIDDAMKYMNARFPSPCRYLFVEEEEDDLLTPIEMKVLDGRHEWTICKLPDNSRSKPNGQKFRTVDSTLISEVFE